MEDKAPPAPLVAIGVPTSKGKGREGRGKGGEGGKGKDDLHHTLF